MSSEYKTAIWPDFERDFWPLYDKKRGKPNALKWWAKMTQKEREACMDALPTYIAATPDKVYRKDPERYLRHKCWEDEVIAANQQSGAFYAGGGLDEKSRLMHELIARKYASANGNDLSGY